MALRSMMLVGIVLVAAPGSQSAEGLEKEVKGKDGAPMVLIPEGSFPMGVPHGDRDGGRDEYPRHDVFVNNFYIDKFEVTNGRYLEFVKATNHRIPQNPKNATRNLWQGDDHSESLADRPVINVDWADANAYCQWAGKRLPTEAEWEKAAKGTADRRFPWGNVEPTNKHLNFNQQWIGEKTLMPVGSYELGKSPFGVYDMAGNVWEWVNDWYDAKYYEKSPAKNPPVRRPGPSACFVDQAGRTKLRPSASSPVWTAIRPSVTNRPGSAVRWMCGQSSVADE